MMEGQVGEGMDLLVEGQVGEGGWVPHGSHDGGTGG